MSRINVGCTRVTLEVRDDEYTESKFLFEENGLSNLCGKPESES